MSSEPEIEAFVDVAIGVGEIDAEGVDGGSQRHEGLRDE
jgi:hypothetical protein